MAEYELNTKGLDSILRALKSKAVVRIGILGKSSSRSNGNLTNAEIGAMHEFGTSKLPKRSFLFEPIVENMDKELKNSELIDKETLSILVKKSEPEVLLAKIGIIAEGIVADAFASNGFGKWAAWSPGYQNNTGSILVDTQQLRNSVSSEVK